MENFRDMADQFLAAKAGVQVASGPQLGKVWVQLIEDNTLRERMGRAARELSERNRGATARAIARITAPCAARRNDDESPGLAFCGRSRCRMGWSFASARCLPPRHLSSQGESTACVISVGNLTVGGTGKTPMVLWIAQRLLAEGKNVGILTRGYRGKPATGRTKQESGCLSRNDERRSPIAQSALGEQRRFRRRRRPLRSRPRAC